MRSIRNQFSITVIRTIQKYDVPKNKHICNRSNVYNSKLEYNLKILTPTEHANSFDHSYDEKFVSLRAL